METTVPEKQKKGMMHMYKMYTGKLKHVSNSLSSPKNLTLRGLWGLSRSKTVGEVDLQSTGMNGVIDGEKAPVAEEIGESVSGEWRKSVSYIEVNAATAAEYLQAKVLVTDMPAFMQIHAFRCARRTYDSHEAVSSKQLAHALKEEFDKVYGPAWHCIVGLSFGSFVTHSAGCFLYFTIEKLHILIFRTKVQRV